MKRNILLSLLVIGAVTALVGAASWATFSDTETSTGNVISTGSLNLLVGTNDGSGCSYTDDPFTAPLFSLINAAPGDSQEKTICLKNDGTIDGVLSVAITGSDVEVGDCNEPELAAGDTTCTDGQAGELAANTNVDIWDDSPTCNNIKEPGESSVWIGTADSLGSLGSLGPFTYAAGQEECVGVQVTVSSLAGNEVQTDALTGDATFTLVQS